jgi:uncharacterized membrane protein
VRSSKPEITGTAHTPGSSRDSWGAQFVVLPGVWGGLVLARSSFTPSLLPRGAITQGIVGGISAAIGYGAGVLIAFVWRALVDREPRPGSLQVWRVTGLVGVVGTFAAVLFGRYGRGEILALMGAPPSAGWRVLLTPVVGVAIAVALVSSGRGVRSASRALSRLLGRRIGRCVTPAPPRGSNPPTARDGPVAPDRWSTGTALAGKAEPSSPTGRPSNS